MNKRILLVFMALTMLALPLAAAERGGVATLRVRVTVEPVVQAGPVMTSNALLDSSLGAGLAWPIKAQNQVVTQNLPVSSIASEWGPISGSCNAAGVHAASHQPAAQNCDVTLSTSLFVAK